VIAASTSRLRIERASNGIYVKALRQTLRVTAERIRSKSPDQS
jgi:hypothetical protein